MENHTLTKQCVAVVGAGPAGLFAARELSASGICTAVLNRDIKPGGLAEYGIYPDKLRMKNGLRKQFQQILELPCVNYFGNVSVGNGGALTLESLLEMGFAAVLVSTGAQGTKWLGLDGEYLQGVYHAKDLVYHYNHLPPYSGLPFDLGRRAMIVGIGNVMMDIAYHLLRHSGAGEVIAVGRRGPGEIKFDLHELERVGAYLDLPDLEAELRRCAPAMQAVGQDPAETMAFIQSALPKAAPVSSPGCLKLRFMLSPVRISGNENHHVRKVDLEHNQLSRDERGEVRASGTGRFTQMKVDTVVFAVGDAVDPNLGLPVQRGAYPVSPQPRFPVEGQSFESTMNGVFLAGWSRNASTGLVGIARRDGVMAAQAIQQYLQQCSAEDQPGVRPQVMRVLETRLQRAGIRYVQAQDLAVLHEAEVQAAASRGLSEYKFDRNEDMLNLMGR